jgi:hypothetical protein
MTDFYLTGAVLLRHPSAALFLLPVTPEAGACLRQIQA